MQTNTCDEVANENRLAIAIQMRSDGAKLKDIGKRLGITHQAVSVMLRNDKRRIAAQLEAGRIAKAKESEERFDVVKATEELVALNLGAVKDDPADARMSGAAYTGLRLLAQLRGELVERRENKNENHEVRDIDGGYFETLLARFSRMADADKGKTYPGDTSVVPGSNESVLVRDNGDNGHG